MFIPFMAVPVEIPTVTPQYQMQYQDSNHPRVWGTTPKWIRDLAKCIRQHESKHDYRAHNATSSAAGAYQFIDATWQGNARWTLWNGQRIAVTYKAANHAPPWIQDMVFIHSIKNGGIHNWNGTGCGNAT
jgi:muramidase (phage lysozyme)